MALSDVDKAAAKALVKLGIIGKDEIGEWIEGMEEIDYDGGLLQLLEDEGRIDAAAKRKVEKALAAATGPAKADKAPAKAGGKPEAAPAKASAPAKPSPREEAGGEDAAGDGAGKRGRPGREKQKAGRRPSGGSEAAKPGGKRKIFIAAGAVAVLVAVICVVAVVAGGGGGGGKPDGGGGGSDGTKPGPGGGSAEAGNKPSPPGAGPGGVPAKPAAQSEVFAYRFREKTRILYDVSTETTNTSTAERLVTREEQNMFINCLGETDGKRMTCVEHQSTTTVTRPTKDPEKAGHNYIEFLLLDVDGSTESERRMGALPLAWALAEPRFPKDGKVYDGAWTLDMDTKEGRFEFEYKVKGGEEVEGRKCRKVVVKARFPGGAPPSSFILRKAEASIWFDNTEGIIAKSQSDLVTAQADAPDTAPPLVTCSLSRVLRGADPLEPKELTDVAKASDFYFDILNLIEEKSYNKAYKKLEEPDLESKYFVMIPDLIKRVPGVRMSLQAQLAMRERQRKTFRDVPWRRPEHGPAMVTSEPVPVPAKERKLDMIGKAAPEWIAKEIRVKDKPTIVYVGCAWLPPTYAVLRLAQELGKNNKDRFDLCGIVDAKDWGERIRFIMGAGGRVSHKVTFVDENTLRGFNLAGVPALFVVDPSGTVKYACVGVLPDVTKKDVEMALGIKS